MSDDMKEQGCDAYDDELAELALGVLTGRERARVLVHVESCPRCAEELEQLSRTADAVVQVAPEVEPPLGFEVRLFERMGVADASVAAAPAPAPPRWVPAVAGAPRPPWRCWPSGSASGSASSSPSPNVTAQAKPHGVVTAAPGRERQRRSATS